MNFAVGQRWLWNVDNVSIVIIEITKIEPPRFYFCTVQVIKSYYSVDRVGYTSFFYRNSIFSNPNFTYLEGQDK
jgi:hypothetical protein